MKLIVGLGNVGDKFQPSRHNLGFKVIDALAKAAGLPPAADRSKFEALVTEGELAGERVVLAKPTTMMNLSGQAVGKLARFYKLDAADVWVVYDEVDLEFGKLRVRLGGGSAGHNGVKSIIAALGDGFGRFRFGVGNAALADRPTDAFVLSAFDKDEAEHLPDMIERTVGQVLAHLKNRELIDTTYDLLGYSKTK